MKKVAVVLSLTLSYYDKIIQNIKNTPKLKWEENGKVN